MEVRTCADGLGVKAWVDRSLGGSNNTYIQTLLTRREDESDLPQADILKATIAKLDESLKAHDVQKLQFTLLNGLLKVRVRRGFVSCCSGASRSSYLITK